MDADGTNFTRTEMLMLWRVQYGFTELHMNTARVARMYCTTLGFRK